MIDLIDEILENILLLLLVTMGLYIVSGIITAILCWLFNLI